MPVSREFQIGTAHWNIPQEARDEFPAAGSHLLRYSFCLGSVEINSSFYRDHLPKTYRRWAAETPPGFRFSVKLSRAFTHDARLLPSGDSLRACLDGIRELGEKWAVLLVQLPPSLEFEHKRAENFLSFLRDHCPARLAWEPRHPTWTTTPALALLERFGVAKVLADPERCPAPILSSDRFLRYYRLHGSPIPYRSRYRAHFLSKLARELQECPSAQTWVIFDNTTFGYATLNALELGALLASDGRSRQRIVS